jgi:hypothetical protein
MDTKMIMIIVAVVLVLISSSVGAYFMMSGGEESSSSTPSSSSSSTSTPPPPATPPATPPPPPADVCNKTACNAVMQDWIVNKYWAFSDTAKNFGECKNCNSRWFTAPFKTSNDGNNWQNNANRNAAYDAVKL